MYKFFIVLLGVTVTCASDLAYKIPLYQKPGSMRQELVGRMESRRSFDLTISKTNKIGPQKQYYANVAFGSPPQKVVAAFDTGYSDVWVLSEKCKRYICKAAHPTYNSSLSGSYEANGTSMNITYNYNWESVRGFLSTDFITIAGARFKQTFTEVEDVTNYFLFFMEYDATVGLGFRSKSASGAPTMFENMVAATNITPIFSFYFNRDPTATGGGLLTLGGLNQSHFLGDLLYAPLVSSSDWMFSIEHFHVGQSELSTDISDALVATGYEYILAPRAIAEKLYETLGAITEVYGIRIYKTVNCTTVANLPAFTFTISGKKIKFESSDYIKEESEENDEEKPVTVCTVTVLPTDKPRWVLGQVFLGRYYSVYDVGQKRIGFAEAVRPFIG